MEVGTKLGERQARLHRRAVIHHMQIIVAEIDDTAPVRVFYIRIDDVPFFRHRPVEQLRAGRHLMDRQRYLLADAPEALTQSFSSDAAADRKQLSDKVEHLPAFGRKI